MKNKKTKRIVIGVVVLIIIIYFAPINLYQSYRCVLKTNGETYWCRGMISSLYKKHKDKVDETKLLASSVKLDTIYELPTYIGNFKLSDSVGSLPSQCFSLYDFSNPKSVCIVLSEAKYFNGATLEMVNVNIYRVVVGKELFTDYMKNDFSKVEFEGYDIGRVDAGDFSWFPTNGIDFIKVKESLGVKDFNGNFNYIMSTKTKGTSLVTSYFLEKYPPNKSKN